MRIDAPPLETAMLEINLTGFRKKIAAGLLAGSLAFGSLASAQVLRVSTAEPKYTAIVMDYRTGEVLYSERADNPRYPASVTKVMTLYLVFEALQSGRLHLSDRVVISAHAAAQAPSRLGLKPGESISVDNAIQALTVHSANDIAVALAEKIGGSESNFAHMMTAKAHELGMHNSQYVNANGLPDDRQISSAHDIAILCRALLKTYPQYYHYFSEPSFTYNGRTMPNHNQLLGRMPGLDGVKTGFTNAAGFNLAASAMRNGNRLIAVVLGSPSSRERNANVEGLLLTGFDIMDRRAHGEHIQVVQNYFTPGVTYRGVERPALDRADPNDDPIGVVLTSGATKQGPITLSTTMPKK